MPRRPRAQLAFTLTLAVAGWAVVIGAAAQAGGLAVGLGPALFAAIILVTRALAFPIASLAGGLGAGPGEPRAVLSLDSGFHVAAALALGPARAGLLVALALSVDAAVRRWREQAPGGLAYVAYFGGMTGAMVAAATWLVAVAAPDVDGSELAICLRVVAIGVVLLFAHNLVQGARRALGGEAPARFIREQAGPGIVAELSLLPVAAVATLLYLDGHRLGFGLLAATHLLLNLVFNRLARASAAGRARVRELELLDGSARALGASIALPHVVATVTREAARAVTSAETVALVHRGAARDTERLVVDSYERGRERHARVWIARGEGATGRVLASGSPLRLDELAASDVALGPAGTDGVRSWLGVPVVAHGACEGVLVVASRRPGAFTAADERLLGSLALQAGAALANAHLYEMAMVDGLTGLFVRRYFDARLEQELERARRAGAPFAVAMLDVDDFKRLNDEHGHLVGDRVLRTIATVVREQLRGVDTAARYGGEEVALILPGIELPAALVHAERVRGAIAEQRVTLDDGGPALSITASVGIAAYPDSGADSGEELVRRADRALYRAKRAGKNRVELFWDDDSGRHASPTAS